MHNEPLSERMKRHLESVTESSGLPPGEESFARIVEIWNEKRRFFEEQIRQRGMKQIDTFEKDDNRGAIALTYSGSLISLGCNSPAVKAPNAPKSGRWFEYVSIKLRKDVPNIVMGQCVEVVDDIRRDAPAEFRMCPIKKSSEILAIAIYEDEGSVTEQEQRIRDTTTAITDGFIEINKQLGLLED